MTVRDRIADALERRAFTALQLSQEVGVPHGDIASHLEHLARSLPHRGLVLDIQAARCLACGFEFEDRRRKKRPSRCPECRSERIEPPSFSIKAR